MTDIIAALDETDDSGLAAWRLARLLEGGDRPYVLMTGGTVTPFSIHDLTLRGTVLLHGGEPLLDLDAVFSGDETMQTGDSMSFLFNDAGLAGTPSEAWLKHVERGETQARRGGAFCVAGSSLFATGLSCARMAPSFMFPGEWTGNRYSYLSVDGVEVGYLHSSETVVEWRSDGFVVTLPGFGRIDSAQIVGGDQNEYDGDGDRTVLVLADGRSLLFSPTRRRTRKAHNRAVNAPADRDRLAA
jgi:hypothetical protein